MDNPSRKSTSLPVQQMTVADGNWDTVRDYPIRMIVIHTIVGTVKSADAVFNSPHSQRSTHYGVGEDGKLYQWVDETNVAYQAGKYAVNQYSIGIEHEDNGNYNAPRTDALYTESSKLVADIAAFYHIALDRDHIKKHSEVSDAPTACPDSLDIDRIIQGAVALTTQQPPAEQTLKVSLDDWRGLLVEAGSLEKIAPLFGFTQADCKDDIDVGSKIVEKIKALQFSTARIGNDTTSASATPPGAVAQQGQPIPTFTPVQKNWLQSVFSLLFGKLQ